MGPPLERLHGDPARVHGPPAQGPGRRAAARPGRGAAPRRQGDRRHPVQRRAGGCARHGRRWRNRGLRGGASRRWRAVRRDLAAHRRRALRGRVLHLERRLELHRQPAGSGRTAHGRAVGALRRPVRGDPGDARVSRGPRHRELCDRQPRVALDGALRGLRVPVPDRGSLRQRHRAAGDARRDLPLRRRRDAPSGRSAGSVSPRVAAVRGPPVERHPRRGLPARARQHDELHDRPAPRAMRMRRR